MTDGSMGHSPKRTAFIRSLMKKFNMSHASVFIMGIEALVQMERDINDIISFGQYVKACYYPSTNVVKKEMEGRTVFDYMYIYAIYLDKKSKPIVVYKDNPDKDCFKIKTKRVKKVDDYVLDHFTLEKGLIPE